MKTPETPEVQRLREAIQLAIDHTDELEDAWQRGAIVESDGMGGTRSNRNVEVNRALRKALGTTGHVLEEVKDLRGLT